jgi:hypothetical protein
MVELNKLKSRKANRNGNGIMDWIVITTCNGIEKDGIVITMCNGMVGCGME